jgi:hypothetical protein
LKDLVVRVLFDPKIVFSNNACRHLGPADCVRFEDAIANIVDNDIEITTTRYYGRWLKERWSIPRSERHNRSDTILTEHEARRLYSSVLLEATFEDLKLFNLVTWAIGRAGTPSVTGKQIARLARPRSPAIVADKLTGIARKGLTAEAKGLFVVQEDMFVARYLAAPSVAVHGGQWAKEVLSLRFGIADIGATCLGTGWSASEDGFTWTDGTQSTLRLQPPNSDGACVVRIFGWPFIVRKVLTKQEVLISVNEKQIGSCTIRDVCVIEFEIPRSMRAAGEPLEIRLTVPGAMPPNELKDTEDSRVLGFCLEKVVVLTFAGNRLTGL